MNGNVMNFNNVRAAMAYVREMDEEATAAIGDQEVWKHDSGAVLIGVTAEGIIEDEGEESADDWRLLGTVAQVLY